MLQKQILTPEQVSYCFATLFFVAQQIFLAHRAIDNCQMYCLKLYFLRPNQHLFVRIQQ